MKYLVIGTEGPTITSPQQAVTLLEKTVLPSLEMMITLETEKKILGGGLPVGDRAVAFIIEATSHDELDKLLRDIPLWGQLKWKITPLQSFSSRATIDRNNLNELKKSNH